MTEKRHYLNYALVTPARNEETHIEKTIQSVVSQTVLPMKWVIVSDNSTDQTDGIVRKYLGQYEWMELLRLSEPRERNFAAKVECFKAGFDRLSGLNFDIVGNLDGDLSFEGDYIEFLLNRFADNPKLGVAGTPFIEDGFQGYNYKYANIEHVSGACQLFRKDCFKDIGGYVPIKGGGIDWVAATTARMKGWQTRTFTEKACFHHRPMGTGSCSLLMARFKLGKEDYYLGGHPLWHLVRTAYQTKEKPHIIGALCLMLGYVSAACSGMKRPLSAELIAFHRSEQLSRLRKMLYRTIGVSR